MKTIGLIAAIPQESEALLRYIKGWKRIALGSFRSYRFELAGHSCLLVTSGMGVRRASAATRTLVEMSAPHILISFGIAGAVEADLQIGDVITVESVCRLEQGVPGTLLPLSSWSEAAQEAAAQALSGHGKRLLTGTAVTTTGSQIVEYLPGKMLHPILEMETAGIAEVAAEQGIALLSLRAISDGPCSPIPFDLGKIMNEDANLQVGRLLNAIARNPKIVFQFRQLRRNTRIAADNAAIALIAALSQADF
jgi:adenosylhomocysteine nucleosidase